MIYCLMEMEMTNPQWAPMWLCVCLTMSGHATNELMDDERSPTSGSGHYCAPGQSEGQPGVVGWTKKIMSQRCSVGFRSGSLGGQSVYQFPYPPGTTWIPSPHEPGHDTSPANGLRTF